MSRPLRIEFPGAWYHVTSRGAGRKSIFRKPEHRQLFCDLLGQTRILFKWEVHAYCLMDNHYHLLVRTPLGNLGRSMRHLNGVYTQRFNRSMGTDGPLFRGRYKSILIDADNYLLQVSRYIHRDPLEAGRLECLQDPQYCSYPYYLRGLKKCKWLDTSCVLEMMGPGNSRKLYKSYVEEAVVDEVSRFYSKGRVSPVLGGEEFLKEIEKFLQGQSLSPEVSGVRTLRKPPSISAIQEICATYFRIKKRDLIRSRARLPNNPRDFAIYLSRMTGGYKLTEISRQFGGMSYSGVSKAIGRLRLKIKTDKKMALQKKKLNRIVMKVRV